MHDFPVYLFYYDLKSKTQNLELFNIHKIWSVPYDQQPNNLRQLGEAIIADHECHNTDQLIIQRSFDSMVTRARLCIRAEGYPFPDE